MRDPSRIIPFCERLAELWSNVPDWRFGQLVSNTLGTDPFYMEDEDALRSMERFFHIREEDVR